MPAAITALLARTRAASLVVGASLVGRTVAARSRAGPPRRIRRNSRTTIAPKSSATPVPMISQITLLTWLERIGRSSEEPSGCPSASVSEQRHVADAERRRRGVEQHGRPAARADRRRCRGHRTSQRRVGHRSSRTVTGWSRSFVTVAANRPLPLERMTAVGASMLHRPSRSSIHARDRSLTPGAPRLEPGGVGRGRSSPRRGPCRPTWSLRVNRFCSVSPAATGRRPRRSPAASSSRSSWPRGSAAGRWRPRSAGRAADRVDRGRG